MFHSTEVAAVTLPGFSVAYPASFGVAVSNQRAGSAVVFQFFSAVVVGHESPENLKKLAESWVSIVRYDIGYSM